MPARMHVECQTQLSQLNCTALHSTGVMRSSPGARCNPLSAQFERHPLGTTQNSRDRFKGVLGCVSSHVSPSTAFHSSGHAEDRVLIFSDPQTHTVLRHGKEEDQESREQWGRPTQGRTAAAASKRGFLAEDAPIPNVPNGMFGT